MQELTVALVLERARAVGAVANEAKHLQFEGGNTEADEAPIHQKRQPKNSSVTDVEALTTWQQNALIRTSVATNAKIMAIIILVDRSVIPLTTV